MKENRKLFFEEIDVEKIFSKIVHMRNWKVEKYLEASGDENSIHKSNNESIVPGALTLGWISAAISENFADASLVSEITASFKKPMYIGMYAYIKIQIIEKKSRDKNGLVKFNVTVLNEKDFPAVSGIGKVWVARKFVRTKVKVEKKELTRV